MQENDSARGNITPEEAEGLILKRWEATLYKTIFAYLQNHSRLLLSDIENLQDKYTLPLHNILSDRDKDTQLLNNYLIELGYE